MSLKLLMTTKSWENTALFAWKFLDPLIAISICMRFPKSEVEDVLKKLIVKNPEKVLGSAKALELFLGVEDLEDPIFKVYDIFYDIFCILIVVVVLASRTCYYSSFLFG